MVLDAVSPRCQLPSLPMSTVPAVHRVLAPVTHVMHCVPTAVLFAFFVSESFKNSLFLLDSAFSFLNLDQHL